MKVTPSKDCESRSWWCNVKHLRGQKMEVKRVEEHFITFIAERGRLRRWHKSNLSIVKSIQLENK